MIGLILEIMILVSGVYSLVTAKPLLAKKEKIKHPHFRLLGGFQVALLPVAIIAMMIAGAILYTRHPNQEQFERALDDNRFLFGGIEFGLVIIWVIISTIWDKAIRKRVAAGR